MKTHSLIMILSIILLPVALFSGSQPALADEVFRIQYDGGEVRKSYPENTRPVVGLALSGGGARGLSHLGVIEVLENAGISIDRIAGTSMGSIVGGLYAAGYSAEYLEELFTSMDWSNAVSRTPKRRSTLVGLKEVSDWPLFELRFKDMKAQIPSGLSTGQYFISILSWLCMAPTFESGRDFDKLKIPYRTVATDLNTGMEAVLSDGNLARAIQSSSTVPFVFTPVIRDSLRLVDGGLVDNLPVGVTRGMGTDFVIASAVEESMHPAEELDNPLKIIDNVTSIPMRRVTRRSKKDADFVISPDMEGFSSTRFSDAQQIIEQGRIAARDALPALKEAIRKAKASSKSVYIADIEIQPAEERNYLEKTIADMLTIGEMTSYADIAGILEVLWKTGSYCNIEARYVPESGVLSIEAIRVPQKVEFYVYLNGGEAIDTMRLELSGRATPSMQHVMNTAMNHLHNIRAQGNSFAYIGSTSYNKAQNEYRINILIPRLKKIIIDPAIKSRNSVIMREFNIKPGNPFNQFSVMRSIDNLYGTNLFEWAYADVANDNGDVVMTIRAKEKDTWVARFGLRYDEMYHAKGRLNLSRENILGFGNRLNVTWQVGERNKLIKFDNNNDRIYKSLYTSHIRFYRDYRLRPVFADHKNTHDYEEDRYGAFISLGQHMDRLGNAIIKLKSETVTVNTDSTVNVKGKDREIRSVVIQSLIDSYDRYPFPTNGSLNMIYIESTSEALGGTERFVKLFWYGDMVRTYWRRHTFSGSFSFGTSDPSTPGIEQFTLGGSPSRLHCMNPESGMSHFYAPFPGLAPEEYYGTRLAVVHGGYRLFVPRYFYLDLIYSAGNVWRQNETINSDNILQAYGVTASFSTFGGPMSVGWGITSKGDDWLSIQTGWEF